MILEFLAVAIPSLLIGAGIMKLLLKNPKIEQKIDRSETKKYEAMDNPELLLKKLNENGTMVDDGDEITFTLEEKDGKKELVQHIKKNEVAPGPPKAKPKPAGANKKATPKGKKKVVKK